MGILIFFESADTVHLHSASCTKFEKFINGCVKCYFLMSVFKLIAYLVSPSCPSSDVGVG